MIMRLFCIVFLSLLGGISTSFANASSQTAVGAWRGALEYARADGVVHQVYFGVNISEDEGQFSGVVSAYQIGLEEELKTITIADDDVLINFPFLDDEGHLSLSVIDLDTMTGTLTSIQGQRKVRLERVFTDIDHDFLVKQAGLYELENGEQIVLAARRWTFAVYNFQSWEFRTYFPRNETTFIAGPGALLPASAQSQITFLAGTDETEIIYRTNAGVEIKGKKSARIVQEEISFANGDTKLAGLLIRPSSIETHVPGAVIAWGSGRQDRYGFSGQPYYRAVWLAQNGFATIVYDKRGVGASGGSYEDRTHDDLAGDMAAAVDFLATRPEVDSNRTGLLVHSQSGIYAPKTISMTDNVNFTAVIAASVVRGDIQEIMRTEQQLRADGWPDNDINDAVATQILKFFYANERIGWEAYLQSFQRVVDKPWFETIIGSTVDIERHSWDFWKQGNSFDPAEPWNDVEVPVLYMIGDLDPINDIDGSIRAIESAFSGDRSNLLKITRYPEAEHGLFEAKYGGILEEAEISQLNPYLPDVLQWLADIEIVQK